MLILLAAMSALIAPPGLALPEGGQVLVTALAGEGVQTYRCDHAMDRPGGYAWTFEAPQAVLTDPSGRIMGRHFAGPTWVAADGGKVVGQPLAKVKSPDGLGVDWLLLRARSAPGGKGLFAGVSYVRRLSTIGGRPPATGCSATTVGQTAASPYSAIYEFYRGPRRGGVAR